MDPKQECTQQTAQLPAPAAGEWKPIETAPRDGSYFLAGNKHGVWAAHWVEFSAGGYRFPDPIRSVMLNHWHITPRSSKYLPATHWMPLPAAPQGDSR